MTTSQKNTLRENGLMMRGKQLVADPTAPMRARMFIARLRTVADETERKALAATEAKARILRQNARAARRDADRIEASL